MGNVKIKVFPKTSLYKTVATTKTKCSWKPSKYKPIPRETWQMDAILKNKKSAPEHSEELLNVLETYLMTHQFAGKGSVLSAQLHKVHAAGLSGKV